MSQIQASLGFVIGHSFYESVALNISDTYMKSSESQLTRAGVIYIHKSLKIKIYLASLD